MTEEQRREPLALPPRIGIDFAGVIVQSGTIARGTGTIFDEERPLLSHTRPGTLEAVRALVSITEGETWIVSKARESMQPVIRGYLAEIDFFATTGLNPDHLRFTLDREGKRAVCLECGLTQFLDDRLAVLEILRGAVPHLFWFAKESQRGDAPRGVRAVCSWPEFLGFLGV